MSDPTPETDAPAPPTRPSSPGLNEWVMTDADMEIVRSLRPIPPFPAPPAASPAADAVTWPPLDDAAVARLREAWNPTLYYVSHYDGRGFSPSQCTMLNSIGGLLARLAAAESARDSHAARLEHVLAESRRLREGWEATADWIPRDSYVRDAPPATDARIVELKAWLLLLAGTVRAYADAPEDDRWRHWDDICLSAGYLVPAALARLDAAERAAKLWHDEATATRRDLARYVARCNEALNQRDGIRQVVAAMEAACGLPDAGDATRRVLAIGQAYRERAEVPDGWPALRPADQDPGGIALVLLSKSDSHEPSGWATATYWRDAEPGTSRWMGEYHPGCRVLGWVPLPPVPGRPAGEARSREEGRI